MNIWDYFESVLLPQLYPTKWLDKVEPRFKDDENVRDFPGKLFLNDLNTKLLTGARIRQLRSQKGFDFLLIEKIVVPRKFRSRNIFEKGAKYKKDMH